MDVCEDWSLALPFNRRLQFQDPLLSGNDIVILQNLLRRHKAVTSLNANGKFDEETRNALCSFQKTEKLNPTNGVLNPQCAIKILNLLMSDNYKDNGIIPDYCKFKLHVPVYRDRNVETNATLYKCNNGNVELLHVFKVRTRGSTGEQGQALNQLTTKGDTPTGLSTLDLNSKGPEELVKTFGTCPVLRVVKGMEGNTAIGKDHCIGINGSDTLLPNYRNGILVHTGIWDDWDKSKPMNNSLGCMHVYPDDMEKIADLLIKKTGAIVNDNLFGKLPYPYHPQGIICVEEID